MLIQLWEHDPGDPSKIRDGGAAAFAASGVILTASGVAAWVGAVVAGVGKVVHWLLGFLEDDYIADQMFAVTRQLIEDRIKKSGQSFTIAKRFADGDAEKHHEAGDERGGRRHCRAMPAVRGGRPFSQRSLLGVRQSTG